VHWIRVPRMVSPSSSPSRAAPDHFEQDSPHSCASQGLFCIGWRPCWLPESSCGVTRETPDNGLRHFWEWVQSPWMPLLQHPTANAVSFEQGLRYPRTYETALYPRECDNRRFFVYTRRHLGVRPSTGWEQRMPSSAYPRGDEPKSQGINWEDVKLMAGGFGVLFPVFRRTELGIRWVDHGDCGGSVLYREVVNLSE
jgi:hypothetical protein